MDKEAPCHFVPAYCGTPEKGYMPVISAIAFNSDDTRDVVVESIRFDFNTPDPRKAFQTAIDDHKNMLAKCTILPTLEERRHCMASTLKQMGYELTYKTIKDLLLNTVSEEVVH
jgi:hypothetical protein